MSEASAQKRIPRVQPEQSQEESKHHPLLSHTSLAFVGRRILQQLWTSFKGCKIGLPSILWTIKVAIKKKRKLFQLTNLGHRPSSSFKLIAKDTVKVKVLLGRRRAGDQPFSARRRGGRVGFVPQGLMRFAGFLFVFDWFN